MNIVTEISEWRKLRATLANKTIGFVPTMGNLHAGHLSLCARAKRENDIVVVSVFVNPTQFNQASDFERYPRTLEQDKLQLETIGVDYLLIFDASAMYQDEYQVQVVESVLSIELEGEYRPGHFTGMLTVVLKLLNLVQATHAYFGEKDFQQCLLVKKMVAALFLSTEIVACPTIRAEDQLALSSRNSRLSAEQREKAVLFPQLLMSDLPVEEVIAKLEQNNFKVDYIFEKWGRRLGAVWLGDVRLIDNVMIGEY